MKTQLSKSIFHIVTLFGLLAALFGFQPATPALAAENAPGLLPVQQLLKPDGTLDLGAGYSGSLDIANYGVTLDPARGPVLKPLMTIGSWNALGTTPLNGEVDVIAINGTDAYVGGQFINAGGIANADYIAKWNGSTWSALGTTPLNQYVFTIVINGADVYAGGEFTNADHLGDGADYIAKFSSGAWSPLGPGLNNSVGAIAISGANIYAGGVFTDAGGDPNADFIAKWNGAAWSALGTTPLGNAVYAIGVNGTDIYAGGNFLNAGGDPNADYIAKWNGAAWSALGTTPLNGEVDVIVINGTDAYVGGQFTDAGGNANADYIAKFSGSTWSALGTTPLNGSVKVITISGTDVYAGGDFTNAGGDANANYIAKFSGGAWSALGGGLNNSVNAIGVSGANVYAGGSFLNADGNANADNIARFVPDTTPPTVVSITRVNASPTNLASVSYTVTFSESVTGVDASDFNVTIVSDAITGASVTSVSADSGATRTVTVNTGSKNGTIRLDVKASATGIQDLAGNPISGGFTGGQTYTVDKTVTLTLYSIGAQDGWVLESGENSKKGGTMNSKIQTFLLGDNVARRQYLGILSFNSGAGIPDTATITGVTLRVKKQAIAGGGNPLAIFKGFMVDVRKGFFGTTSALQTGDFQAAASHAAYGPFIPPLSSGGWYNINLTSAQAYINKLSTASGLTQIRLRFKIDDNNNAIANILSLYSGNAAVANRPQLVIQYVP